MKQYTSNNQAAKLIELGFEKPKNTQYIQRAKARNLHSPFIEFGEPEFEGSYSIGELLSLLPISFETDNDDTSWLEIEAGAVWSVAYSSFGFIDYDCERKELIDALFDMIVTLKKKEII